MACVNKAAIANLRKINFWLKIKKIRIIKSLRSRLVKVKIKKRFRSRVYEKFKVKWTRINDKKS